MNDNVFKKWVASYPKEIRHEFHRDGIIDENIFKKEKIKILFVIKEPNAKHGRYNRFCGMDLREVFGKICLRKPLDYNIARWTKIICDGFDVGNSLKWKDVATTIRRTAIINLKKIAGSGSENREEICLYSFKDKDFIKEQISEINPDLILACGKDGIIFRMIWRIMNEKICFPDANISEYDVCLRKRSVPVFCSYHPSIRPMQYNEAARAVEKIAKYFIKTHRSN